MFTLPITGVPDEDIGDVGGEFIVVAAVFEIGVVSEDAFEFVAAGAVAEVDAVGVAADGLVDGDG